MKEIGIIEKNYFVVQNGSRKFTIEFRVGEHKVSIENFKFYDERSEETLNFYGDLILDGINVGKCSNDGKGGCADYYAYGHWDLAGQIGKEISVIENYCFPSIHLSLDSVIDALACFIVTFKENKVSSIKKAKAIIDILNKQADKYREMYSK